MAWLQRAPQTRRENSVRLCSRTARQCAGLRSPVDVAARMAAESRESTPAGRVRPMMLAGDGARRWALARGLPAAGSAKAAEQVLPAVVPKLVAPYRGMCEDSCGSKPCPLALLSMRADTNGGFAAHMQAAR